MYPPTVESLKRKAAQWGNPFFEQDTMDFFQSSVDPKLYTVGDECIIFITHETSPWGYSGYTIRQMVFAGRRIFTVGEKYSRYRTVDQAHKVADRYVRLRRRAWLKSSS